MNCVKLPSVLLQLSSGPQNCSPHFTPLVRSHGPQLSGPQFTPLPVRRSAFYPRPTFAGHRVISLSAAFKLSSELAQESWQVKWDQEPAGFFTRQLIPQVNTKIKFPRSRDVGISYCRLLLHDTMLRQDSFRTGVWYSNVQVWNGTRNSGTFLTSLSWTSRSQISHDWWHWHDLVHFKV